MSLPNALSLTERLRYRSLWKNLRSDFEGELERLETGLRESAKGSRAPVPQAALQLIEAGGKRVRPLLAWLCCSAIGARAQYADPIALAAELTHTATLLHDDVIDDAAQRRGMPAPRILHGNRISVLAGDFLLTRAMEAALKTSREEILRSYNRCLQDMVEGEVVQEEWLFRPDVPEAIYRQIVDCKTAALFAWAAEAGAVMGGADEKTAKALRAFGRGAGVAFQILDDWLDWVGEGAHVGKAVRSDLKEGKPSLAVIYACEMSPAARKWFEANVRRDAPPPSEEEIARLAGELVQCGALDRVRTALETETAAAIASLEALSDTAARARLVRFAKLLLARDK
ncbi:MAG: polyprenyl synthetase family protein [Bdellovibrionota bacterium]